MIATSRKCNHQDAEGHEDCDRLLRSYETFAYPGDPTKCLCMQHWQAAEDAGQMRLPEAPAPSLFDALDEVKN